MPEIFTWSPQKGYSAERTPNVAVVKLGDGYEQRQTKGINTLMAKYSLTFKGVDGSCNRPNAAKEANAFLIARMMGKWFLSTKQTSSGMSFMGWPPVATRWVFVAAMKTG